MKYLRSAWEIPRVRVTYGGIYNECDISENILSRFSWNSKEVCFKIVMANGGSTHTAMVPFHALYYNPPNHIWEY